MMVMMVMMTMTMMDDAGVDDARPWWKWVVTWCG
jgi:hypothetical protein